MKCPKCRSNNLRVSNTNNCSDHLIRYRYCENCSHRVLTEERIVKYKDRFRPNVKLDKQKVLTIREEAEKDEKAGVLKTLSVAGLAKEYGVHKSTIKDIINKKTWKNVD